VLKRSNRQTLHFCQGESDVRRSEIDFCVNSNRHRFRLKYVWGLFCIKLQHSCIFTEHRTEDLLVHFLHPVILSVI